MIYCNLQEEIIKEIVMNVKNMELLAHMVVYIGILVLFIVMFLPIIIASLCCNDNYCIVIGILVNLIWIGWDYSPLVRIFQIK